MAAKRVIHCSIRQSGRRQSMAKHLNWNLSISLTSARGFDGFQFANLRWRPCNALHMQVAMRCAVRTGSSEISCHSGNKRTGKIPLAICAGRGQRKRQKIVCYGCHCPFIADENTKKKLKSILQKQNKIKEIAVGRCTKEEEKPTRWNSKWRNF